MLRLKLDNEAFTLQSSIGLKCHNLVCLSRIENFATFSNCAGNSLFKIVCKLFQETTLICKRDHLGSNVWPSVNGFQSS